MKINCHAIMAENQPLEKFQYEARELGDFDVEVKERMYIRGRDRSAVIQIRHAESKGRTRAQQQADHPFFG